MASRYHFDQGRPSIEERIGTALGTGLGQGLTQLAESKLQNMISRQERMAGKQRLESLGIPSNEAEYLSQLDPNAQWDAVRQWWMAGGGSPQDLPESLEQEWVLPGEEGEEPQGAMEALQQPMAPQTAGDLVTQQGPMSPFVKQALDKIQLPQQQGAMQALQQPIAPQEQPQQPSAMQALGVQQQPMAPQQPRAPRSFAEAFRKVSPQSMAQRKEEAAKRKEDFSREKFEYEKQEAIDKATEPFYSEIKAREKGSQESDVRLNRMLELIDKGDLPTPGGAVLMETLSHLIPIPFTGKSIGLDLRPIAYSANAQEFDKLSNDFLKNAKQFFGSQVTQGEIELFLKTVPTLLQNDEGKKAVARNMHLFNEINHIKNEALERIIEENGGKRPRNLERLVEIATKDEINEVSDQFKKGVKISKQIAKANSPDGKLRKNTRKDWNKLVS